MSSRSIAKPQSSESHAHAVLRYVSHGAWWFMLGMMRTIRGDDHIRISFWTSTVFKTSKIIHVATALFLITVAGEAGPIPVDIWRSKWVTPRTARQAITGPCRQLRFIFAPKENVVSSLKRTCFWNVGKRMRAAQRKAQTGTATRNLSTVSQTCKRGNDTKMHFHVRVMCDNDLTIRRMNVRLAIKIISTQEIFIVHTWPVQRSH